MSEVQQDNRIDRTYAYFHRVLGELLTELSALPGVLWLSDKEQHVLGGEGERNAYARAVYRVIFTHFPGVAVKQL